MKGFYWHCHHDILLEWCYDYDERVKFIKESKPENEVESRLRLFKKVKGKLPVEVIEAAEEAYGKASKAYDKAWKAYSKAREAFGKTREAYVKAREAYDKAKEACDKALENNKKALEKLHKKECPNCIWDSKELNFNTLIKKKKNLK